MKGADKMIVLNGKYNSAKVFTDNIEESAKEQIIDLCDSEFAKYSNICIMPDVHAGAGCTIGTTMTIQDKIVPNLVGVDISCGLEVMKIKSNNINLERLDNFINANIPSGFSVRDKPYQFDKPVDLWLNKLKCLKYVDLNLDRAYKSIGTLGGGKKMIATVSVNS